MTTKSFRFDGQPFLGGGLSFSLTRNIATKDYAGTAVAVDVPRYGRRSILCGAPVVTAVSNAGSGSWNVMTTGVDADGSAPVLCLQDITGGKLHIFKNAIVIDGSGNSTYVYDMTNGTSGSPDALQESADANDDGLGTLGNYNYHPKGGVCVHGRIDLLCSVAYRDAGPAWRRNRVGMISCNIEDLAGARTTWWRKSWLSLETPQCDTNDLTNLAIGWALQAWSTPTADGSSPTEYTIAPADYQSDTTQKHGGFVHVCRITRPSTGSGTWTPGVFQQALTFSRPANGAHAHGGLVVHASDGSAKVIVSRGDSSANNGMYIGAIAAMSSYDAGSSAEGSGSYNSTSGGTGIGTMTIVNGRIGGLTGSPPAVDDTHESARRFGLQPLGLQRGPGVDSILCGIDEQHVAILMASSIPTSGGFTFTPVFRAGRFTPVAGKASGSSAKINTSRMCLQLINRHPNKPTPEIIANVSPQSSAYQQEVMCYGVYSPNGVEFGICWNTKEAEQARPGFFGSTIIIGSPTSRGYGVRTIPLPSYLHGRPLMVDTGGVNYLADGALTLTKSSGMTADAGSELNITETLPASYTPAPGFGTPIYFAADAASGSGAAKFLVRLCDGTPALPAVTAGTTSHLLVQFAIHPAKVADWRSAGNGGVGSKDLPAPDSATDIGSNSCSQGFRFRIRMASTDFTGYTENIYIPTNDGTPHVITIPVAVSAYAARSAGYTVELYVESTSISFPIKGWLTPIGVYVTEAAPCPVAQEATAPSTAISISGFTLPTTGWTAYWSGKVPGTPLLDMACAQSHTNTTATRTSVTVTRLAGVSTGLNSITNAFAGHRLFGVVNSQSATFGNYGLAIASSAYVSTGVHDITHATHGQASGSWTQIDITCPSAAAVRQPLFALANTDRSRLIAVYLDCLDGKIKADYYNGSAWTGWTGTAWNGSEANLTGYFFTPECPVHVALSYNGSGTLTIRASAGGQEAASATLSVTPDQALTQMIAGDGTSVAPMEWWGGMVVETTESSTQQGSTLQNLAFGAAPLMTNEEVRKFGA